MKVKETFLKYFYNLYEFNISGSVLKIREWMLYTKNKGRYTLRGI